MYSKNDLKWIKHIDFILIDIICLILSFILAYLYRFKGSDGFVPLEQNELYKNLLIVYLLVDIISIFAFNTYKNILKRSVKEEIIKTIEHLVSVALMISFYLMSMKASANYSRIFLYMVIIIDAFVLTISKTIWKAILKKNKANQRDNKSLLIITTKALVDEVTNKISDNSYGFYRIAGVYVIDEEINVKEINGVEVIHPSSDLVEYISRMWVDEVIFNIPFDDAFPYDLLDDIEIMGITTHLSISNLKASNSNTQYVEKVGGYTVITSAVKYASPFEIIAKRMLDIVGSIVGIFFMCIIALFIGPKIKKESPGPLFFKQQRVGQNGKLFYMWKFRSMYLDAEERKKELMSQNRVKDGMMFKMDFDPRIIGNEVLPDGTHKTGIGDFIRRTSLDEFPQFINVLKGDMSLVGTRPPTMDEWKKYQKHHRARLAIKPGITGMWQVSGRSDITDFEEIIALDTKYIREWSLWLDIQILFRTVIGVLKKDGAM